MRRLPGTTAAHVVAALKLTDTYCVIRTPEGDPYDPTDRVFGSVPHKGRPYVRPKEQGEQLYFAF